MNYPKAGLFITPQNLYEQYLINDLLYSDDLFFDEENNGFFIGVKGTMRSAVKESLELQFKDEHIKAIVHICEPNAINGIQFYND